MFTQFINYSRSNSLAVFNAPETSNSLLFPSVFGNRPAIKITVKKIPDNEYALANMVLTRQMIADKQKSVDKEDLKTAINPTDPKWTNR